MKYSLVLFTLEMEPLRFYGRSSLVNPIPGDGSQSDDELAGDSDMELETEMHFQNQSGNITVEETDVESESDDEPLVAPKSKTLKATTSKKKGTNFLEKLSSSCLRRRAIQI